MTRRAAPQARADAQATPPALDENLKYRRAAGTLLTRSGSDYRSGDHELGNALSQRMRLRGPGGCVMPADNSDGPAKRPVDGAREARLLALMMSIFFVLSLTLNALAD